VNAQKINVQKIKKLIKIKKYFLRKLKNFRFFYIILKMKNSTNKQKYKTRRKTNGNE